jgi:hypothetical protein
MPDLKPGYNPISNPTVLENMQSRPVSQVGSITARWRYRMARIRAVRVRRICCDGTTRTDAQRDIVRIVSGGLMCCVSLRIVTRGARIPQPSQNGFFRLSRGCLTDVRQAIFQSQ